MSENYSPEMKDALKHVEKMGRLDDPIMRLIDCMLVELISIRSSVEYLVSRSLM